MCQPRRVHRGCYVIRPVFTPSVKILKYADDTTIIIGLISDDAESQYHKKVKWAMDCFTENKLHLNASETKEMVVYMRRRPHTNAPSFICAQPITFTDSFQFFDSHISHNLKWDINTTHLIKKASQRLYFLRQLKKFHVNKNLLELFYKAIIQFTSTLFRQVYRY